MLSSVVEVLEPRKRSYIVNIVTVCKISASKLCKLVKKTNDIGGAIIQISESPLPTSVHLKFTHASES